MPADTARRTLRADIDRRPNTGDRVELLREFDRKPNATVARRVARVVAAVERDAILVDALHPRHWRIVVFLRTVEWPLVEHGEDAGRRRLAIAAGRSLRDRHQSVAAIEIRDLIGETDDHSLRSGVLRNIPPQILTGLEPLEAKRLEHVERRARGGVVRLHLRFE